MSEKINIDTSWDRRKNNSKNTGKTINDRNEMANKEIDVNNDSYQKVARIKKEIFANQEEIKKLMVIRPNWNEYFMILAKIAATRSTCLSRTNGAVIVKGRQIIATGYNGSMPGVGHCSEEGSCFRRRSGTSDHDKYSDSMASSCRSIHAEANAIAQAAKKGISIEGSVIYMTLFPCYQCAKLLASAGIKKVYYEYEYTSPDAGRDELWFKALIDAGIEIEMVKLKEESILKTIMNLVMVTAWRRELLPTGEPTGRIENINMDTLFKAIEQNDFGG